jgi:DNA ligase (NAD+)
MIRFLDLRKPSQIMKLPDLMVSDMAVEPAYPGEDMLISDAMENWEGYGKTSIKKLMTAIKKARNVQIDRFIYALGIRNIGRSTARDIAKELKTVDAFFQLPLAEGRFAKAVGHLDGIGPVAVNSFEDFFNNDISYEEAFALRLACEVQDMPVNAEGPKPLSGEVICFTGGFDRFTRDQLLIIADELGAKTTNAAAKKTTILVAGSNVGAKKIEAAEKFGCAVKDPEWFYGVVDAAVSKGYELGVME